MLRVRCLRGGSRGAEAVHYIGSRVRASRSSAGCRMAAGGRPDSPLRGWRDLWVRWPARAFSGKMRARVHGESLQADFFSPNADPRGSRESWNESILSPTCRGALPSASLGCPRACLRTLPCSWTGIVLAVEVCQQLVLEQLSIALSLWVSTLGSLQLLSGGFLTA